MSTADPSEGSGHRLGTFMTLRDTGFERQFDVGCATRRALDFQLVNNDDDCVIVQSAHSTECRRRSSEHSPCDAGSTDAQSMLLVIGVMACAQTPNLSLAFRELTAVTSTAAQSARGVTDRSA